MKKSLLGIGVMMAFVIPSTSQASPVESFDIIFNDDVYLKEEVTSFSTLREGGVLGASTDTTTSAPAVTKKLDKVFESYVQDITIKPPKGWQVTDDVEVFEEGPGFSTYVVNDEMTAQIAVLRFYDEKSTLKSLEKDVLDLCELCGYKVEKKGATKLGKLKGRYVEATSPDTHFVIHIFDIGDVSYLIQTSAPVDEWKQYKSILSKSYKSIKIDTEMILEEQL